MKRGLEGVVPMTESRVSGTASSTGALAERERGPGRPAAVPPPPSAGSRPSGWTGGRITALVIGAVLVLVALGLNGAGAVALWADLSRRDSAGYVTTDVHAFSTAGSALTTDPVELGNPGVEWLYSTVVLGEVRIRVTPTNAGSSTFVGIGPSADVNAYLAGVGHTRISDFWSENVEPVAGGTPSTPPEAQGFWVASASGMGPQTLTWDPANGSWTVVVMNADGKPGVAVSTDLGATMPSLIGIAVVALVIGGVFLIGGVIVIAIAIRRIRRAPTKSV
jgi:hypothetical protein